MCLFHTTKVYPKIGKPFLNASIASLMVNAIISNHEKKYILYAYVVMPDHFHFIIKPINEISLMQIMQSLKGSTAYFINKFLNRSGKF